MNLWLRHPILTYLVWHAPRVRGTRENPLTVRDIERLLRLLYESALSSPETTE